MANRSGKGFVYGTAAACLILLAASLLLSRTTNQDATPKIIRADYRETSSETTLAPCNVSSSGIRLCDLPLEQRKQEELREELNRRLAAAYGGSQDDDHYSPPKAVLRKARVSEAASVRLKVAIPTYDHADMIAGDLKNADGVWDVYWSPPDIFDIRYDAAVTSVDNILARGIFRKYNATVDAIG